MVVTFYREGKFVWETSIDEGGKEQSIDGLINECRQICGTFGGDIDWEIGLVSVESGNGLDNLTRKIKDLSFELDKIFDKNRAVD
jgi:hypothetical protein